MLYMQKHYSHRKCCGGSKEMEYYAPRLSFVFRSGAQYKANTKRIILLGESLSVNTAPTTSPNFLSYPNYGQKGGGRVL